MLGQQIRRETADRLDLRHLDHDALTVVTMAMSTMVILAMSTRVSVAISNVE